MARQLLLLVIGFFLTSVLGGTLGFIFQRRTWTQQERSKLLEAERLAARTVFEDLSRLMDKRLYRMRHFNWALQRSHGQTEESADLEGHRDKLRDVLYEWNDNLHRNLALVLSYFGNEMRIYLEDTIFEEFKRIQAKLESAYREIRNAGSPRDHDFDQELYVLGTYVYSINVGMISRIQEGKVGRFNPATPASSVSVIGRTGRRLAELQEFPLWPGAYFGLPGPTGAIGKGLGVQAVQQRLIEVGYQRCPVGELTADGFFGKITESAVRAFQSEKGLSADGRVGERTWSKLLEGKRR